MNDKAWFTRDAQPLLGCWRSIHAHSCGSGGSGGSGGGSSGDAGIPARGEHSALRCAVASVMSDAESAAGSITHL